MILWTRSTLPMIALVLAACAPLEEVSTSGNVDPTETEGEPTTTTTVPGTTLPGDATSVGTMDGTGMSTMTMGPVDTTMDVSTADGETTMGVDPTTSGSSSSGVRPECENPGECENNETCDSGMCVPACNPWGDGDYGYCLTPLGTYDSEVLCGEALSCINSGNPTEVVVCGRTCATQCDCAEPPPTGDAVVTCGNITGGGSDRCYLSCASGETCPDDMVCRDGTYCTHPVQPLEMYGNCDNIAAPCHNGECAVANGGMGQTWSVCVTLCPGGIGDCDAAPAGASMGAACNGVIAPPAGFECHLACNGTVDCPTGMECINAGGLAPFCMWP